MKRPNSPRAVGGGEHRGVPLAAHPFVPAFHEMLQQFLHLRPQTHAALHHRFPEGQQDGARLRRSFPGQALHPQPAEDNQVAGMGAVAAPGAGPATGAGGRGIGQGPLAFGGGRRWD